MAGVKTRDFVSASAAAIKDPQLRKALERVGTGFDAARRDSIAEVTPQVWEEWREEARRIKTHTLEHLETLAQLARGFGVKSLDMGFYVGSRERDGKMKKVSAAELEKASVKPVVFATYGMVALGTNGPWWDAMILGTPKGDAKQTIGRILREYPDKKTPVVFDVVDICSELFTDWAFGRDGYYKSPELNSQQDVEIIDLEVPDGYE